MAANQPPAGLGPAPGSPGGYAGPPAEDRGRKKRLLVGAVVVVGILALGGLSFAVVANHEGSASRKAVSVPPATTSGPAPTTPRQVTVTTIPVSTTSRPTTTVRRATTTVATTTTLAVTERPGYAAAKDISQLLSQSTADRQGVVAAVADVADCGDVGQDQSTLSAAAQSRQELINSVQQLDVALLPDGPTIQSDLINAWNDSLDSDEAYSNWASDQTGGCTPNDTADPNYQQAAQADTASTQAKEAFVAAWNPVAGGFGLPAVTPDQI